MSKLKAEKTKSSSKSRTPSETVVAVFPGSKTGIKALQALEHAVDKSTSIETIPFEKLDFGDLKALDKFYSAPVVVVDVTERQYEACLFYQIGLRESFGMKHNVVMCVDQESSYVTAGKNSFAPDQTSSSTLGVCFVVCLKWSVVAMLYKLHGGEPLALQYFTSSMLCSACKLCFVHVLQFAHIKEVYTTTESGHSNTSFHPLP